MDQTAPSPYCGPVLGPSDLWMGWNADPVLLVVLAVIFAALWRMAPDARARRWAWVALALAMLAFVSPLCAATVALFAARSAHHLVVSLLLAPAIAMALGGRGRALPTAWGCVALAVMMVLWHLPAAYDAAWRSHGIYWLMQAGLLGSAVVFWQAVLRDLDRPETGLAAGLQIAALSGAMGLIGAVLTFAAAPLYLQHVLSAPLYGIAPLSDQQLAGLIMWGPGAAPLAWIALRRLTAGLLREAAE